MNGNCESCGTTAELDCLYNDSTGEERYLCERCVREFVEEEESYEDIERQESDVLTRQEHSAYKRGIGGY